MTSRLLNTLASLGLFMSVSLVSGCVETHSNAAPRTAMQLKTELQTLGVMPQFQDFLSIEAASAGVQGFRPLQRIRNLGRDPNAARLYGVTQPSRIIYLDVETALGRSPFIILHEIAHAPHYGGACGGHHSAWASEFAGNAARFEARFPAERWQGLSPTVMADQLAQSYGVGTKCP